MDAIIYKICSRALWDEALAHGAFRGAPIDLADGYIHFSTAAQVEETAAKHFNGQQGLLLLAVDAGALASALRYEPSRNNALFPHLYADLPLSAVLSTHELPIGEDGKHLFPSLA